MRNIDYLVSENGEIMEQPRLRTSMSPVPVKGELNSLPSMTQPDMTLTMRQLLENHTRGTYALKEYNPVFNEENEVPNFKAMDLVEIQEYRMRLAEQMENDKQKLADLARLQEQKARDEMEQQRKAITDEVKNSLANLKND